MTRRKAELRQPSDDAPAKPPVRVMRRRRRGPAGSKPRADEAKAQERTRSAPERGEDHGASPPPAPMRMSRAPRPAELPPKNPNVFSYTYTIWKST